jgi:heptosyltransferase-2
LAAGKNPIEQEIINKVINSNHNANCLSLGFMDISETLPIIKNCNLAVSNDTSFSHISAALGVNTIVLMTDTPLLYGNYSTKMTPVLPEGRTNVTHDSLGKEKVNPEEIYIKAKKILNL